VRSLTDLENCGAYIFFCSNSCAAYCNKALDEIGGFSPVLIGEDTLAAAHLLTKGHKIAYVADAIVRHSHCYSLIQEFKRNFDIGLSRKQNSHLFSMLSDCKLGALYAKEMLKKLNKQPVKIPYALCHLLARWLGYFIGQKSSKAPMWVKKKLSSQDFYWVSKNAKESLGKD
jgi:rhamnosyltransferase